MPSQSTPYRIEPLVKTHERAEFSCGKERLDAYLQKQASQDAERYVAAPFVLVRPPSRKVLGYYTLSSSSVDLEDLPADIAKKLPRYPDLPVTLLGRLAVDLHMKSSGLGEILLMDALRRSVQGAEQIGAVAVIVDAKDTEAKAFYEHFDFTAFEDEPMRLFLPMKTIGKLFR